MEGGDLVSGTTEQVKVIFMVVGLCVILFGLLYLECKLLGKYMIKRETKRLRTKSLTDKKNLKYRKNFSQRSLFMYVLFLGIFPYFALKKYYAEVYELYDQEATKRKLV